MGEVFDWKWNLTDLKNDKPVTVFSCFSCGGGSTMGYKKAGFKVLGNVEIDPRMNRMYVKNHHPLYSFNMDLREFNKKPDSELPPELFDLDILDGSPPCTTFSMVGLREAVWGRPKKFAEGQKVQVLDDLFFTFLETVAKLSPRVVVAENVVGIVRGRAKGYCNQIIKTFRSLGYDVQMFRLNGAYMDVPQTRERIFFIANREHFPKLRLEFHNQVIPFGAVRSEKGVEWAKGEGMMVKKLKYLKPGDTDMGSINIRLVGHDTGFANNIIWDDRVAPTQTASGTHIRACDKLLLSPVDNRNMATFPQDYDFCGNDVHYVCGMSVPPNMMAHVASEIWRQWLSRYPRRKDA